jgi:hypothetical protein
MVKRKYAKYLSFVFCFSVVIWSKTAFSEGIPDQLPGETPSLVTRKVEKEIGTPTLLLPNRAGKVISTPSGWGASAYTVFVGAGFNYPAPYSKNQGDGGMAWGIGLGDPVKYLGAQLGASMSDLDEGDNFSGFFKVHRYLGYGTSIAGGGSALFADQESDADETWYGVLSHAFQQFPSNVPGKSRLHISIGGGNGRFADKSDEDRKDGKGDHGTYVFSAIAIELHETTNFIIEWNAMNLGVGLSFAPFEKIPVGLTVGAADLTTYSGDGPRLTLSGGIALTF